VRLNGVDTFVIWYQDERNGFVHREDGQLLVAPSLDMLASEAYHQEFKLAEELAEYDQAAGAG
jgi:hypothetical protein